MTRCRVAMARSARAVRAREDDKREPLTGMALQHHATASDAMMIIQTGDPPDRSARTLFHVGRYRGRHPVPGPADAPSGRRSVRAARGRARDRVGVLLAATTT